MTRRKLPRDTEDIYPPYLYERYRATIKRSPRADLVELSEPTVSELTGPGALLSTILPEDSDLTTNSGTGDEAIGQRIIVTGRVLDERGAPFRRALVEVWQANAAGRYRHRVDQHEAPLDPNFLGSGRCLTDEQGIYRFTSIIPGAYPFANGENAWRASHIHFSLFGAQWRARLVTQMYFPNNPLNDHDDIVASLPAAARSRLIARYAHDVTVPFFALGYRWDIYLRGEAATPFEPPRFV